MPDKLTILEIHPQIHKVNSPRTDLGDEGQKVPVAHLVRDVLDHHRSPRVQTLFNPIQIELILLRNRGWWDTWRPDMKSGRRMVRLLILMTRGNRGLSRGIQAARGWGGEHGRNWTKQDGGARVVRILGHMFRVIDGGGMYHRGRCRVWRITIVPVEHGSVGEMTLDRRVHIWVWRILVVHCGGFIELGERIRCWRLQRVDKLSRVGRIVELRCGKMIGSGRKLRGVGVLHLRLWFCCRVARLQDVSFRSRRGDEN